MYLFLINLLKSYQSIICVVLDSSTNSGEVYPTWLSAIKIFECKCLKNFQELGLERIAIEKLWTGED